MSVHTTYVHLRLFLNRAPPPYLSHLEKRSLAVSPSTRYLFSFLPPFSSPFRSKYVQSNIKGGAPLRPYYSAILTSANFVLPPFFPPA
jgi:hypothetical protein